MSSVCDELFERKTGTPIARSPSSNTQEVQLWSSRLSPSLMTNVSYHRFAILSSVFVKVFEKILERSGNKEPPPLVHVHVYAYVCVYVCVHPQTHRPICTGTHRHTTPGTLLTRSQMMVDWTQNDTPFSTVILTLNFDPENRPFQVTV